MAEPARRLDEPEAPGNADSTPPGQAELKVMEGGGQTTPRSKDHLKEAGGEDVERDNLAGSEEEGGGSFYSGSQADGTSEGSLYKKPRGQGKLSLRGRLTRKRAIFGGGIASILLITSFISFFGFLNVFKLDGIMSNIDAKTFARFDSATNARSDRWIRAYFQLRLTQISGTGAVGADGESEYFRANRVDTNSPVRDWYHTLRTSSFESDLAKQGLVFVNQDIPSADGRSRIHFVTLQVDGKQIAGLSAGDVRSGKLVDWLNEANPNKNILSKVDINLSEPGGSKKARAVIKNATRDVNVIKRRQVRKAIQNETGVRSWRFFETTRDKVNSTKIDIRNKIITTAIPESTKSGKFIRCLFGISTCVFSDDPVSPDNKATAGLTEVSTSDGQPVSEVDANRQPVKNPEKVPSDKAFESVSKITSNILEKANLTLSAVNIVSTLDAFSHIDSALQKGDLSKGIVVARAVQAMGLYQTFETARDQLKTGQVTGPEVNDLMKVIGPVASSEAWTKVVNGSGDPSKLTNTPASTSYCSQKHQALLANDPVQSNKEFAYLCPDKQIGGGSKAASIEQAYKDTIGAVIGPVLSAYTLGRNIPIFGDIITAVTNIINGVSGAITAAILNITGLNGPLDKVMGEVTGKLVAFLGAGPILNGNESAGQFMNWAVQGGAYSAETSSRANGASLTTPQSAQASSLVAARYQNETNGNSSSLDKLASLSNSNSLAYKAVFGLSQFRLSNWSSYLGGGLKSLASIFTLPFNHHALAANTNLYSGDQFAGIKTYDFPPQCYNLDPITATPEDGTNIREVMSKNGVDIPSSDITWDLVNNSDSWYQYIYDKLKDKKDGADAIAEQIYNCNLLDTSVRGGLGYLYGYSNDNGLDETVANITSTSTGNASTGNYENPLRAVKNLVSKRIDEGADFSGSGPIYAIGDGKIDFFHYPDSGWTKENPGIFMSYTLTDGPASGKSVYVAENCIPQKTWKVGDVVNSNTVLCDLVDANPWLETGWAPGGQAIALAKSVYAEGHATILGSNFDQLLQNLKVAPGTYDYPAEKGHEVGLLPAGWPTW